jgi:DNA-binding transcriptional ArsR family regulator
MIDRLGNPNTIYNQMVMELEERLDRIFGALASPTRRAILAELTESEQTVLGLVGKFDISQPGITKHLNVLEGAGLIERRKEGRTRICMMDPNALEGATNWIEQCRQYWKESFQALEGVLEELQQGGGQ